MYIVYTGSLISFWGVMDVPNNLNMSILHIVADTFSLDENLIVHVIFTLSIGIP